jgi:hypothetical protein
MEELGSEDFQESRKILTASSPDISPTPGVMIWGAISYDHKSTLVFIPGRMTALAYIRDVINPVVLPFLARIESAVFQNDNARQHIARVIQQSLADVDVMPWPPRSQDLSPIEHV